MPPKKSKTSSSQPLPARQTRGSATPQPPDSQPIRQTRGGRKRRHSDASNISEQSQQSTATPKRARRGKKATTEAEYEHELLKEVVEEEEVEVDGVETQAGAAEPTESVEIMEERHVHFSNGDESHHESMVHLDEFGNRSTATQITPHPKANKRRITASPGIYGIGHEAKRIKHTTRHSLPPILSQQEETTIREEYDFAPFPEVLAETMQRIKHTSGEDADMADESFTVLRGQQESTFRQSSHASTSLSFSQSLIEDAKPSPGSLIEELSLSQSQTRAAEASWALERKRFHDHILALSNEADEARQHLKIIEIELNGLVNEEGELSWEAVLTTMRQTFSRTRERLESILPDSIPEHASSMDIVEILVANVSEFAQRLRVLDHDLNDKDNLVAELGSQIRGLMDRLAQINIRKEELEVRFEELDKTNDVKTVEIEDLQEQLLNTEQERDNLEDLLNVKTKEFEALSVENREFQIQLGRTLTSLEEYQAREKELESKIFKMEEDHAKTFASINKEREETVRDLEDRLDEQSQLRTEAEKIGDERQITITEHELRIETLEIERDSLQNELTEVTAQRDEEQAFREKAESDLEEAAGKVEELTDRINVLEEQLSELTNEITELRNLSEAERAQREAAETELDDRNAEIEELNEKLTAKGKEGNELRQKIWEAQQDHKAKISGMELLVSERDEQYQSTLAGEVERREASEEVAQQRAAKILELETSLAEIELQMRNLLEERDERIQDLESELAHKNGEIETLREELKASEDQYEAEVAHRAQEREELEASIVSLKVTITKHELEITHLHDQATVASDLHDNEMEDRNARIAELNHDVAKKQAYIADLEKEKESLEHRVEAEAMQMLQLDSVKTAEIDNLKQQLIDKQKKILVVEEKHKETDKAWEDWAEGRRAEFEELAAIAEKKTETITTLEGEMHSIRQTMMAYVEETNAEMQDLRKQIAVLHANADEVTEERESKGERLLGEIASMSAFKITSKTTSTEQSSRSSWWASQSAQQSSASKKKTPKRVTRGRRNIDSGIGVAADDIMDESMMEEIAE